MGWTPLESGVQPIGLFRRLDDQDETTSKSAPVIAHKNCVRARCGRFARETLSRALEEARSGGGDAEANALLRLTHHVQMFHNI